MAAAQAVSVARAMKRACRAAAPSGPSAAASRVLAKPGSGALARIATATASRPARAMAVSRRELVGRGAEKETEPQAPHRQHGPHHAVLLPAPPRGQCLGADA